jgi:hypothetical protein
LIINSRLWINPMVWIDAADTAADNFPADDPNRRKYICFLPYYS